MPKARDLYLFFIAVPGVLLIVAGVLTLSAAAEPGKFLLLLALALIAQFAATPLMQGKVTVDVSTAVAMAAVPEYGPLGAGLIAAVSWILLSWLRSREDRPGWQRITERATFNAGMNGLAVVAAGLTYQTLGRWLGGTTVLSDAVCWLGAAIVNDQLNFWLLMGMLYLQHGARPVETWLENRWAIPINVMVTAVGGAVLAFASREFDTVGIAIFFLPILLSAYAFQVYASRTRAQMGKLEEIITNRTAELTQANEQLAQLHREKDAFLGVLTHDMRVPLTNIHAYTMMLMENGFEHTERTRMLESIWRSERTLLQMVEDILELQQLSAGMPLQLDIEPFDLRALLIESVETIEEQARERHIELILELDRSRAVLISADWRKIQRALLNLLTNAIKYTQEGGTVWVQLDSDQSKAYVTIKDNGYGIPESELPFIFERFRRVAKHRRSAVGTGLGLAIVKSMIEAHQGQITVQSREGHGSCFTITLPRDTQLI
jgi:signal transduction histidine kinase